MKILFVCSDSPLPPMGGAALRTWGLMRAVSRFAEVGLVTLVRSPEERDALDELRSICAWLHTIEAPRNARRKARDWLRAGFSGLPYRVEAAREKTLTAALERALDEWRPDLVQAEGIFAACHLEAISSRAIPRIYSAHNIEHRIGPADKTLSQLWQTSGLRRMAAFERRILANCDGAIAVSNAEAEWLARYGARVHVIPNAIFVNDYSFKPPSGRDGTTLVYTGRLDYAPNVAAARRLALELFPRIRRLLPGARCIIAGRNPPRSIRALDSNGMSVHANPPDMTRIWAESNILVSPLTTGAGTRLKLIEAAACGVSIVATDFSAEGLALASGTDYLSCKHWQDLADRTVSLFEQRELAERLAQQARTTVEQHHDWKALHPSIQAVYESFTADSLQS